jgi:hypothetical protein
MTFINDDGYEEEEFEGRVIFNLDNCDYIDESNSMPITGLRLPTEENEDRIEMEKYRTSTE